MKNVHKICHIIFACDDHGGHVAAAGRPVLPLGLLDLVPLLLLVPGRPVEWPLAGLVNRHLLVVPGQGGLHAAAVLPPVPVHRHAPHVPGQVRHGVLRPAEQPRAVDLHEMDVHEFPQSLIKQNEEKQDQKSYRSAKLNEALKSWSLTAQN